MVSFFGKKPVWFLKVTASFGFNPSLTPYPFLNFLPFEQNSGIFELVGNSHTPSVKGHRVRGDHLQAGTGRSTAGVRGERERRRGGFRGGWRRAHRNRGHRHDGGREGGVAGWVPRAGRVCPRPNFARVLARVKVPLTVVV